MDGWMEGWINEYIVLLDRLVVDGLMCRWMNGRGGWLAARMDGLVDRCIG